jgi:hypothetical protein
LESIHFFARAGERTSDLSISFYFQTPSYLPLSHSGSPWNRYTFNAGNLKKIILLKTLYVKLRFKTFLDHQDKFEFSCAIFNTSTETKLSHEYDAIEIIQFLKLKTRI